MSDAAANPFEELMKMSQGWAEAMAQTAQVFSPEAVEKMWPTMPKEAMETFFGNAFNPAGLDAKTKLLLTLLGLTMQGAIAEAQIRYTVRHALEAGATADSLREAASLAAFFGGVAGVAKSLELIANVVAEREDAA